jgi:starch synthase
MKIVHVASEMALLAKVGGLGDVVYGLSKELIKKKEHVHVILPFYSSILKKQIKNLKKEIFYFYTNGKKHKNEHYFGNLHGIKISLIKPSPNIFSRKNIYGYKDDFYRFLYFSYASLELLKQKNEKTDILHLHDWHTSACSLFLKTIFSKDKPFIKKIVLTIHNLKYQGTGKKSDLTKFGIEKTIPQIKGGTKNSINLLKAGIIYSNAIVTVSPTYSREILTKKFGNNLENLLKKYKNKLYGVLNGIDTNIWSPDKNPYIFEKYSKNDSSKKIQLAKEKNKNYLRQKLKLNKKNAYMIGCISRLVQQKGPTLIKAAILQTLKKDDQFVLLGNGDKSINQTFMKLNKKYKKTKDLSIILAYDEKLAHQIYAACDFIIIPSNFEPCGLTQLIALSYGAIPIVRKTGGLADTVFDKDGSSSKKNGIVFTPFSQKSAKAAVTRALDMTPIEIQSLIKKIMNMDFSWKNSCKEYQKIYKRLLKN